MVILKHFDSESEVNFIWLEFGKGYWKIVKSTILSDEKLNSYIKEMTALALIQYNVVG
jgi:hypothetical protein